MTSLISSIDETRWDDAQSMELWHMHRDTAKEDCHEHGTNVIFKEHFNLNYKKDFIGKTIVESGGGRFPHVAFCGGVKRKISVEPLYSKLDDYCKQFQNNMGIEVIECGFEEYEPENGLDIDEVWFFNVLQHVRDPELQIKKAKEICAICPVLKECTEFIKKNKDQYGIWAGLAPNERKEKGWW